jgi:glycosyltransferase involved in cell wall biosynthesis
MSGDSPDSAQRPSLLVLNLYMVHPPDSGAKVVIYNRMAELSNHFRITFCCLGEHAEDADAARALSPFAEVIVAGGRRDRGVLQSVLDLLANPCALPFAAKLAAWFESDAMQEVLARRFDLVEIHSSCWYRRQLRRVSGLKVLVAHNREREYYAQRARASWRVEPLGASLRALADLFLVALQERRAIAACDAVVSLAPLTQRQQSRWFGERPVLCNWGGVDLEYYRDGAAAGRNPSPQLVFIAALFVESAVEAAASFVADALPAIAREVPGTSLTLVGDHRGNATILRLARDNPNVRASGLVADVRPYLRAADVVVVPILHGSGVRYKIMEALAAGKAVVSTLKGAEGLGLRDGDGILLAPAVEAMAPLVVRVLNDEGLRRRLEDRARAVAAEKFDREAEHRRLATWYRELLEARR